MESRDCTVVDVLRERAEGGIGGRFWGKVCKLFAVDVCFDDPRSFSVLFCPCVLFASGAEARAYDGRCRCLFR